MKITGSLLVSFDFSDDKDSLILLVSRKKKNETVEIINSFQGDEAIELYNKLVTVKGGD